LPHTPPLIHVVDDDAAVVRALKRLLRSWGMEVRTFGSGGEFLSALKGPEDADCSVLDVQMPGMTGLEVQAGLNARGLDVPVIFMTAHETEGAEDQAMNAGAIGFLRKPFADEALVALIRRALDRRGHAAPAAGVKGVDVAEQ
jgi:FixJ family two-component response regulator